LIITASGLTRLYLKKSYSLSVKVIPVSEEVIKNSGEATFLLMRGFKNL
jgi:hypothetical protein